MISLAIKKIGVKEKGNKPKLPHAKERIGGYNFNFCCCKSRKKFERADEKNHLNL